MRASVETGDSGYTDTLGMTVFFNGIEKTYCLTADEELGYIKCIVLPVAAVDNEIVTEELYGEVRILMQSDIEFDKKKKQTQLKMNKGARLTSHRLSL